ncbi:hypothetical protein EDEG_00542 [Edhazardia aedis USNM 41457]|uniref:Uncharacterized protein n=1 Tax=Edhazardia aedis (strain USNM 41457) TaxID=1003232 RepID=J9DIP8_EDHAE|nr:hypothetical protein EDEG_00542 [Edhazardia aedis USNM 41457]|eukprot:EJW01242.1 hypothetical protein EDEG_00542 [Edhazardia aedis USNM 41457]
MQKYLLNHNSILKHKIYKKSYQLSHENSILDYKLISKKTIHFFINMLYLNFKKLICENKKNRYKLNFYDLTSMIVYKKIRLSSKDLSFDKMTKPKIKNSNFLKKIENLN